MRHIEIDDLIGNAFIAYLSEIENSYLSLKKIENYGLAVVNSLKKTGEIFYLRLCRDLTDDFFYYSEDFKKVDTLGETLVFITSTDVTKEFLIKKFCGYLSLDVLLAFRDPENTKVLFEN